MGPPGRLRLAARGVVNTAMTPVRMVVLQAKTSVFLAGRVKQDGPLLPAGIPGSNAPGTFAKPLTAVINGQQRLFGRPEVKSVVPVVRAPKSPFNGKVTERRAFAFGEVPLHEVKAVAKANGATLNDVVVSCCAGALRRYLLSTGEVPQEPLIVCIPYSVRGDDDKQPWANHVTTIFAELPTNVEDPLQQLRLVREEVKSARENVEALPTHLLREASNLIPQTFWKLSVKLMAKAPDWMPGASWNVVVANVRGPVGPWTSRELGRRGSGRSPSSPRRRPERHPAELHRPALLRVHGLPGPAGRPQPAAGLPHRRARRPRRCLRCPRHGARATTTTRPPAPGELIAGPNPTKERE